MEGPAQNARNNYRFRRVYVIWFDFMRTEYDSLFCMEDIWVTKSSEHR